MPLYNLILKIRGFENTKISVVEEYQNNNELLEFMNAFIIDTII